MSLDQLPNELIAHVGTFLNFEDNLQFGLSQKRIHAVLKRDGLDKPECKTLEFTTVVQPRCSFTLPHLTKLSFEEETRDPAFNSPVGQVIDKFRKIEQLTFNFDEKHYFIISNEKMTDDIFKDLLKTKTKLCSLNILYGNVDVVDLNIFIAACKKFNNLCCRRTQLPPELFCDKVFAELIPTTTFNLLYGNGAVGSFDSLTDRTLRALTEPEVKSRFLISHIWTSFTIAGIRTLVGELLKADTFRVNYDLGFIKFTEEINAFRWMEETIADPDCPYTVYRNNRELPPMEINVYEIRMKYGNWRCIEPMFITFITKQVGV